MSTVLFDKNNMAIDVIKAAYEKTPKAFIHSFGCQQNVNDGEIIKGVVCSMGFSLCDKVENADFVLYNTCAIREHAELRVFGNIGALKQLKEINPKLIIAVCGCMAQQKSVVDKLKKSYPYVDIVFGVNKINLLPGMIADKLTMKKKQYAPLDEVPDIIEGMPIRRDSSFRAWLPIMYGCDNYCSYCIVPYVRGRERSRKPDDIMAEFKSLVQAGYKDITLLGQNVNSYGKGLEVNEKVDFSDLLKMLDEIEGEFRIRFMTSHPKDATRKLIDTIAGSKHICHHLHLPVQSGSNDVLRQMNRRYNAQDYLALITYVKQTVPDMTLSSDIIVGFPGETEEDFEKTVELIKDVKYMQLFTFIFSKRSGTKAAEMPDTLPRQEKTRRIQTIIDLQEEIVRERMGEFVGNTYRVLVEGKGREDGQVCARLDNNMTVEFMADKALIGEYADVKIKGSKGAVLAGEMIL